MDYHDLQRKLFEIEPSNPAEDLAKLQAQANGGAVAAPEVPQPVVESVEVPEGSLQMDKNYSLNDFAALAGVSKPSTRVAQPVTESSNSVAVNMDVKDERIAQLEERVARLEAMLEAKKDDRLIKPRDPSAQTMQDLRRSGAMGAHKDKKKLSKQGYQKHKSKEYESSSIKDRLFAELAKYELKK